MGGDKASKAAAERAEMKENERDNLVKLGTRDIRNQFDKTFNEKYYSDIEEAGKKVWEPQVQEKYDEGLRQLEAALIRTGNFQSSARGKTMADAQTEYDRQWRAVGEHAKQVANQRRQDVANAEGVATQQLQASADPSAAAAQTENLININSKEPEYSPLGQVFTDFTAGLATQAELERNNNARYNFGVSNWGNNSRRYMQNVSSKG